MHKVLVVGSSKSPHLTMACNACVRALKSLGVEACFYGYDEQLSRGWIGKIESYLSMGLGVFRIQAALLRTAAQMQPDAILIYNATSILPATIARLSKQFWVSGYYHDDPFGAFSRKPFVRVFRRTIPYYSSHHVVREENITEYQHLGAKHVKLLMTYYIPWIHYPRRGNSLNAQRSLDVVFIGHSERDRRIRYVTDIVNAGIPLRVYGSPTYWHKYLPLDILRRLPSIVPVFGDEYALTISTAKVCLAFFSEGNRDKYAYRVFEIPACKGFLLAERTDVMQSLYEDGLEAEYFSSSDELIDKIRFYLQHDEARERIARRGYERCIFSGYDIVSRMRQWVKDIETWSQG